MGLILMKSKNMFKKIGYAVSAFAAFVFVYTATAGHALAQFSTSTAAQTVDNLTSDVGSVFGSVVVAIIALLAALIGLGMGIRYFKRWIGRK